MVKANILSNLLQRSQELSAALLAAWIANMVCKPSIYEALAYQFLDAKGLRKLAPPEGE